MKIIDVRALAISAVKVVTFARFPDQRGYFTEHYRRSDFSNHPDLDFMRGVEFVQCNESFSRNGTVRGLHFQWNPYMGKLVRTISGRMLDIVLDIRKESPTLGQAIMHDMPADPSAAGQEWIWVPPGFAHGNVFPEDTTIEYFCSGEYSPGCEAGISPFAADISWSLCDSGLKNVFDRIAGHTTLVTDKDRNGLTMTDWLRDERSNHFTMESVKGAA
jgi:dTDP-4-dehydrorhamnose 3,5-epimerase